MAEWRLVLNKQSISSENKKSMACPMLKSYAHYEYGKYDTRVENCNIKAALHRRNPRTKSTPKFLLIDSMFRKIKSLKKSLGKRLPIAPWYSLCISFQWISLFNVFHLLQKN